MRARQRSSHSLSAKRRLFATQSDRSKKILRGSRVCSSLNPPFLPPYSLKKMRNRQVFLHKKRQQKQSLSWNNKLMHHLDLSMIMLQSSCSFIHQPKQSLKRRRRRSRMKSFSSKVRVAMRSRLAWAMGRSAANPPTKWTTCTFKRHNRSAKIHY